MAQSLLHKTHAEIIKRLRRAEGHLRTTLAMLEDERSCLELAQQLHAVEKAISAAKKALIHDHIDHCLDRAGDPASKAAHSALDEFKQISKYL
jgi:DNA-binding FrmR family transcriptional regulator